MVCAGQPYLRKRSASRTGMSGPGRPQLVEEHPTPIRGLVEKDRRPTGWATCPRVYIAGEGAKVAAGQADLRSVRHVAKAAPSASAPRAMIPSVAHWCQRSRKWQVATGKSGLGRHYIQSHMWLSMPDNKAVEFLGFRPLMEQIVARGCVHWAVKRFWKTGGVRGALKRHRLVLVPTSSELRCPKGSWRTQ